jgi:hypothetical protein
VRTGVPGVCGMEAVIKYSISQLSFFIFHFSSAISEKINEKLMVEVLKPLFYRLQSQEDTLYTVATWQSHEALCIE